MIIKIKDHCGPAAADRDLALNIREQQIVPAIDRREQSIVLDFAGVESASEAFLNMLLGEIFQIYGDEVLDKIRLDNCNGSIKQLVAKVIDYSFE